MEYAFQDAHQFALLEKHLTSNPKRVAANCLYQALGFEKKKTNAYGIGIGCVINRCDRIGMVAQNDFLEYFSNYISCLKSKT